MVYCELYQTVWINEVPLYMPDSQHHSYILLTFTQVELGGETRYK